MNREQPHNEMQPIIDHLERSIYDEPENFFGVDEDYDPEAYEE